MSSTPPVKSFNTFRNLVQTPLAERRALADTTYLVHIKGTAPLSFEYAMPARVLQAFAPDAYSQAFQVPATVGECGLVPAFHILILPACAVDPEAVTYVLDWMKECCYVYRPAKMVMPSTFFAWIELLKASQLLQVRIAEAFSWSLVAEFITYNPLEWEHLNCIMRGFPLDSKIVRHLVHNVQYLRHKGGLTLSALNYINTNPYFNQLLDEVTAQYYLNRMNRTTSADPHRHRNHQYGAFYGDGHFNHTGLFNGNNGVM
ncbi:hypothetical protein B0J12DRAFT_729310 [Macrophomina phaseolina]|nr:hypothetical protein B0J12DRAFT_729310 [Macrophomina phaseolina]